MCELFALSADRPVTLRYEMDRFAAEGGERRQNRDGWGIMFAEEQDAHLYREAKPASESLLDRFVREHQRPSHTVMAHVRRASRGQATLANTHPFRRVRQGHVHHFAHNGTFHTLEGREDSIAIAAHCVGETDSEHAFLMLLKRLANDAPDIHNTDLRFSIFSDFSSTMAGYGSANMLFFDSHALYVHADARVWETETGLTPPKPPGLHIFELDCSDRDVHSCAIGEVRELSNRLVMFASVPLNESGWTPLAQGSALLVRNGLVLSQVNTCR